MFKKCAKSVFYRFILIAMVGSILPVSHVMADKILLQSTTSTLNSGLYDALLPQFNDQTGIIVHVVAVGTGKALANGRNCNGDVLLIHSTADEREFVNDGYGLFRKDVMYNDFVIVGPKDDPARIIDEATAKGALDKIAQAKAPFASRADDSGTHKKEIDLWQLAGKDPRPASGTWYLETGSGMGATLNLAVEKQAYTLTDRATWIAFANKQDHRILFEGDTALFNQYGIIPIAPSACPKTKSDLALIFTNWLVSEAGQSAIANYKKADTQLFTPNAR